MVLSDYEYRNIIDYLEANTTYDIGELVAKTDGQLYNMKKRIEAAMHNYPKEIFAYYQTHPAHTPQYTLEQLKKMKYNQLSEIRQSLKIRKSNKVKSSTPAPDTAAQAREAIKEKTTSEVVKDIVKSNQEHVEIEQDEYHFITRSEAVAMYGEDISDEYLAARGFKLYEPIGRTYDGDVERYSLIDAINQLEISLKGIQLTTQDLLTLETEELHYLYHIGCKLEEELKDKKGLKM